MNYTIKAEREYKDTVFTMLFNNKEKLLELYNGINGTNYTEVDDVRINTLENAVYMNAKNDVSCVFRFEMNIYEHQSTLNPNMPLRDLFYVSKLLQSEIDQKKILKDKILYGTKLVKIPTPKFIVFYNGLTDTEDKFEYKLSDAYISETDSPELELKVSVLNINVGKNKKLMEHCKTLYEYSLFVQCIREKLKSENIDEAVKNAVEYCIDNNILADFLRKNKAEVIPVAIYECNMDEVLEKIGNDRYEDGKEDFLLSKIKIKHLKGKSSEQIADELEESIDTINEYIKQLEAK